VNNSRKRKSKTNLKQTKAKRKRHNKKYRSTLKGKIITRFYKFFQYSTKKKGVDESNFHLTPEQYRGLLGERFSGLDPSGVPRFDCHYCKDAPVPFEQLATDHVFAFKKGHKETSYRTVVFCHLSCNNKKNSRTVSEWIQHSHMKAKGRPEFIANARLINPSGHLAIPYPKGQKPTFFPPSGWLEAQAA